MQVTLVSKGEFAKLANISPGRVTQLIAEGKIGRDALDGDGRAAKIRLEVALPQYHARRDPGQATGNGAHARTVLPAMPAQVPSAPELPATPLSAPQQAPSALPISDPVADRIQRERLEQERIKTERMKREEAESAGRYILAEEARAEMIRAASSVLRIVEGGISDMATAISGRFGVPQRDVLHELTRAFREIRTRAAMENRLAAEAMPESVEDRSTEAS
jgi:hypothetical protein